MNEEMIMEPQVNEKPVRTNDPAGLTVWRIIYPILIFAGVDGLLQGLDFFRYLIVELSKGTLNNLLEKVDPTNPLSYWNIYQSLNDLMMDWMAKDAQILLIIRCVILIPVFLILMNKDDKRSLKRGYPVHIDIVNKAGFGVKRVLLTLVLAVATFAGFNMFVSLIRLDAIDPIYKMTESLIFDNSTLTLFLGAGIIGPICEELIFRGLVYRRARNRFGFVPAMIISSVLFGLIHGNLVQFVYAGLVGVVLGWAYEKSNNILIPIMIHIVANCCSCLLSVLYSAEILTEEIPIWLMAVIMVISFVVIFGYYMIFRKDQVAPKNAQKAQES